MNLSINYEKVKSPLRYPGGKSRAVDILLEYIPNIKTLVSPFIGGGSIELACAANGVRVFAYDVFKPLVSFWQILLTNNHSMADIISEYLPLSKENFIHLQKTNPHMDNILEQAATFYVLNRSSFSGSTLSGGMSNDHPRFNQKCIDNIRNFKITNFSVDLMDFRDSINLHKEEFLYLDPPYKLEKNNNLYGVNGSTHKDFNHDGLFELLKDRDNWIMSYNDSSDITSMYSNFPNIIPTWKYGMSTDKNSKEILIFSKNLKYLI